MISERTYIPLCEEPTMQLVSLEKQKGEVNSCNKIWILS